MGVQVMDQPSEHACKGLPASLQTFETDLSTAVQLLHSGYGVCPIGARAQYERHLEVSCSDGLPPRRFRARHNAEGDRSGAVASPLDLTGVEASVRERPARPIDDSLTECTLLRDAWPSPGQSATPSALSSDRRFTALDGHEPWWPTVGRFSLAVGCLPSPRPREGARKARHCIHLSVAGENFPTPSSPFEGLAGPAKVAMPATGCAVPCLLRTSTRNP